MKWSVGDIYEQQQQPIYTQTLRVLKIITLYCYETLGMLKKKFVCFTSI
jgi:hypothetical protein